LSSSDRILVGISLGVPCMLLLLYSLGKRRMRSHAWADVGRAAVRVTIERGAPGEPGGKRTVVVPTRVNSWDSLRGVLGIRPGYTVAVKVVMDGRESWSVLGETEDDVPGKVVRWWEFREGHEYWELPIAQITGLRDALDEEDDPADHWKRNEP
jgi:hypothetical protein